MSGPSSEYTAVVDSIIGGSFKANNTDTRDYNAKINMFRCSMFAMMNRKEPNPFSLYQSEKSRIFGDHENYYLDLIFSQSAPIEIVLGMQFLFMQRSKMHQDYNGLKTQRFMHAGGVDTSYRFFLRPDEIRFQFATIRQVQGVPGRRYENPTPIKIKNGVAVYQLESRKQMIVRRLKEGKYLFGDIGGLAGGAAFWTSHEVFGADFDDSVAIGKMFSDVASFASSASKARQDNKQKAAGLNANTKSSTISIQPHRSRAQASNEKTFDVIRLLPKPTNSTATSLVMKEVLNSTR